MDRYVVKVFDRAGEFDEIECASLYDLLVAVKDARVRYPHKVVSAFNIDRCDCDTDGLTEDEREAVDEVA